MKTVTQFRSTHGLPFEAAKWRSRLFPGANADGNLIAYRVGTCHGIYTSTEKSYDLIAIVNDSPGNGHFDDVLEWFENSCRRDNKSLRVVEIWNQRLLIHLTKKRGFTNLKNGNAEKKFK